MIVYLAFGVRSYSKGVGSCSGDCVFFDTLSIFEICEGVIQLQLEKRFTACYVISNIKLSNINCCVYTVGVFKQNIVCSLVKMPNVKSYKDMSNNVTYNK